MKVDYIEDRTVFVNGKASAEIVFSETSEVIGVHVEGPGARHLVEGLDFGTEEKRNRLRRAGFEPSKRALRFKVAGDVPRPALDDFAQRYADAQFRSATPAVLLAEANAQPLDAIYNWLAQARKKGLLPKGRG